MRATDSQVTQLNDASALLEEQYRTGDNLRARANFHARFGTSTQTWFPWVFDQFTIPIKARILELGCGPGWLWKENAARISPVWTLTLSDWSLGMLAEARANLRDVPHPFTFEQINAEAIPYPDATFDTVIANHMLYHVPDLDRALAEIRRVLKPDGRLYATTNGRAHLQELSDLLHRFDPESDAYTWFSFTYDFTLESATSRLEQHFASVRLRRYEDALIVTETAPLLAYIRSSLPGHLLTDAQAGALHDNLAAEMADTGAILITKDTGLLEAIP